MKINNGIAEWLGKYIAERGVVTMHHWGDYLDIAYTAKCYFGYDISELMENATECYDFPTAEDSTRGVRTVELAGAPTIFVKWMDAWRNYAEDSPCLSAHPRKTASGYYLVRMSCLIDLCIRVETGLRPENIDEIECCDGSTQLPDSSSLWKNNDGTYTLSVPLHLMKQHKRAKTGKFRHLQNFNGPIVPNRKALQFRLVRPETINAIDTYIEHGWRHAKSVVEGISRRLLLNREGMPFPLKGFGATYCNLKHKAAIKYASRNKIDLPLLDRYAHRHVIGAFLERHVPAGNLKTYYLTHRAAQNSDRFYGDQDEEFLRACISEILDGMPSRPEQESLRIQAQSTREQERDQRNKEMLEKLNAMHEEIMNQTKTIEAKDAEIRNLRGRLAEQKQAASNRNA